MSQNVLPTTVGQIQQMSSLEKWKDILAHVSTFNQGYVACLKPQSST